MERRWAGMVSNHEIDERYAADVGIMVDRIETPGAIVPGDVVRLGEGSPAYRSFIAGVPTATPCLQPRGAIASA